MGLKSEVYAYEPTVIYEGKIIPAWETRDGAVYFTNDVEGSKGKADRAQWGGLRTKGIWTSTDSRT